MRILENTDFNFIGRRNMGYVISSILIGISILSLVFRGVELGIDFTGGTEFVVESTESIGVSESRSVLAGPLGAEPEVKLFGAATSLLIRTGVPGEVRDLQNTVMETLQATNPGVGIEITRTDMVGPRFADDLRRGAMYSVLGALLVIFLYIMLRFEWRFSMGAVAALAHDVTIVLGLFSLFWGVLPFSLSIDQAIIAAFLTIVGYSLNDTVVVFDRIREYTNLFKTEPYDRIVNRSINNTLSRTIVTSGTTLLVVTVLFIFGGEVLRGFAFALMAGVLIGTYSSVFVASPVVVELRLRELNKPTKK